jgi:hypothetical protein
MYVLLRSFRAVLAVVTVLALAGTLLDVRLQAAKKAAVVAAKKEAGTQTPAANGLGVLENGTVNVSFPYANAKGNE